MRRLAAALLSALLAAAGMPALGTAAGGCYQVAAGPPAAGAPAAARGDRGRRTPGTSAAGIVAAAHRHGPACKMSCCVVRPARCVVRPARAAAAPAAAAASCASRCGRGQPRQPAGFAAGMPSILPAPPRLPLPRGAALAWRRPEPPAALPFLGVPERPPRA